MTLKSVLALIHFRKSLGILFLITSISASLLETLFMYVSVSIITSESWILIFKRFALDTNIIIVMFLLLGTVAFYISFLNQKVTERIIANSQTNLTQKYLTRLLSSEYALIREYSEPEITNHIYLTTNRISTNFIGGYLNIARQIFNIIVVMIATFYINYKSIVYLLPVILILYSINKIVFLNKIKSYNIDLSLTSQNLFKYIQELNSYTKEILINNKSEIVIGDVTSRKDEFARKQEKLAIWNQISRSSLQYLSIFSVTIAVLYTTLEADFSDEMRVQVITILALLGLKIAPSLNQLIQFNNKVASGKIYLEEYLQVLSSLHVKKRTSLQQVKLSKRDLKYIELSEGSIPSGKGLMSEASREIRIGKLNILVGSSGSGKTTLLDTLGGLWGTYKGLQDTRVVYKSQKTYLHESFFTDLRTKIEFADKGYRSLTPHYIIYELKITDEMLLAENRGGLSGGEVQRLALLDALLTAGDIYLFDEITSGLDVELADAAFQLLRKFSQTNLTIIISHQTNFHQADDEEIRLKLGHIFDGS